MGLSLFFCLLILSFLLLFLKLPDYKAEIEQKITQFLEQPVSIGYLSTYWENTHPTVVISQIHIGNVNYNLIEQFEISINIIESIKQRQWITSRFILKSEKIDLIRQADGRIILADFPMLFKNRQSKSDNQLFFITLLSHQPSIVIHINTFKWIESEKTLYFLTNLKTTLRKKGNAQEIIAEFSLQEIPYVQGGYFSFTQLITWKDKEFITSQGQFHIENMNISSPHKTLNFQRIEGDISVHRVFDKHWNFDINPLIINTIEQQRTRHNIHVEFEQNEKTQSFQWRGNLDFLPANDFVPWMISTFLKKTSQVVGNIEHFQWLYDSHHGFSAEGILQITDFKTEGIAKIERIQYAKGKLHLTSLKKGSVDFENASVTYHDDRFYAHSLFFEQGKGQLSWQFDESKIFLFMKDIQANFQKMPTQVAGNMQFLRGGGLLHSTLKVSAQKGLLSNIYQLIPDNRLTKVANYLKKSLLSGTVKTATLLVDGSPSDVFKKEKGFDLKADIDNAHVDYRTDWPPVYAANGRVSIEGRHLKIDVKQGKMLHSKILNGIVEIKDMMSGNILLEVNGNVKGQTADLIEFIETSPLYKKVSLGKKDLRLKGNMDLDFDLTFPFSKGKNDINLKVDFKNNEIEENRLHTIFTNAKGRLVFKNGDLSGKKIMGYLFEQRVNLDIKANDQGVTMEFSGNADKYLIAKELIHLKSFFKKIPFDEYLSGSTPWTARLDISRNLDIDFILFSDFKGLAIDLPPPLGKTSENQRKFNVIVTASKNTPTTIELHHDSMITALFELGKQGLNRAGISFERQQTQLPDENLSKLRPLFYIEGTLLDFSAIPWGIVFMDIVNNKQGDGSPFGGFVDINLYLKQLKLFSQNFQDVILKAQFSHNQLSTTVLSKNIDGHISYATNKFTSIFKRLHFSEWHKNQITPDKPKTSNADSFNTDFNPQSLPTVDFLCDSLKIGEIDVGSVAVQGESDNKGLNIKNIGIYFPDNSTVKIQGRWDAPQSVHHTQVQAQVAIENTQALLAHLGYTKSPIQEGKTDMTIDLHWQNAPHLLDLKALKGKLSLLIKEGQIVEADPGTLGRILGLFNISVLPRRLALNFRDVFGDGFHFTEIKGDFTIADGKARTENLVIYGVPARVEMHGEADFIRKQLDHVVRVIPDLSNTLPVAGAFASGLGVGALILIIQKMWRTQIEKVANFQYRISGSWDNPEITSMAYDYPEKPE